MLDHVNIPVRNLSISKPFYDQVLKTLSYQCFGLFGDTVGYGKDNWIFGLREAKSNVTKSHVAFVATSVDQVNAFYQAAMTAGGIDNGEPGNRKEYGANYYAAYVLDPDGHNIEAVYRGR